MPDKKGNLYLYEAIELRSEFDRHLELLENLTTETIQRSRFVIHNDEDKDPAEGFDQKDIDDILKKLRTKRIKLNQEIQKTNFEAKIEFKGDNISLAEALDIRKNLLEETKTVAGRVEKSSYRRVIHKEERDIVQEPRYSFSKTYREYKDNISILRMLVNRIHALNHQSTVNFKDE